MDEGYFFDSEFHLNNAGVTVRTAQLIDDIKRERGDATITLSRDEIPEPPGFAPMDVVGGDGVNLYFILEQTERNGQPIWRIVGLNDDGLIQNTIRIPNNIDGIPVSVISANAFAGSLVETIYLGENISVLDAYAFGGASVLKAVYIPSRCLDANGDEIISVPNTPPLATEGANNALKIYVPETALEIFKAGYFWGEYNSFLVGYTPEN